MKRIAFLTMDCLDGFVAYDHLMMTPLARRGCCVEMISWRQQDVCWNDFDLVVIRSPWDYQQDSQQFLKVLRQIDLSTARLENSLAIVAWNLSKSYLKDLQDRGVRIIPTRWRHGLNEALIHQALQEWADEPEARAAEFIVKPTIGANADDTFRFGIHTDKVQLQQIVRTFENRDVMLQPFVPSVTEIGEYSLFYFDGVYSHCVLKSPACGDFRVQEEHGGQLHSVIPDADLLSAAQRVCEAISGMPLYARVDLVRLTDGQPALMEVELIEPSLYLAHDPHATERFAEAILRRLTEPKNTDSASDFSAMR